VCVNQSGYEVVEVGWVDVADGDDVQVWCSGGVEGEAWAGGVWTLLFSMSEALLRTESGSGCGFIHDRCFPLLDSPAA
jgi:hypothetical protein